MKIENKNQLKNNIQNIKIKRIYNFEEDNKIKVGSIAEVKHIQSNAFTLKYDEYDKDCWVYYDSIDIKDNKIYYYAYITERNMERENFKEVIKEKNIDLIELTDKEKEKMNKGSNYNYMYKYVIMINEIIEK